MADMRAHNFFGGLADAAKPFADESRAAKAEERKQAAILAREKILQGLANASRERIADADRTQRASDAKAARDQDQANADREHKRRLGADEKTANFREGQVEREIARIKAESQSRSEAAARDERRTAAAESVAELQRELAKQGLDFDLDKQQYEIINEMKAAFDDGDTDLVNQYSALLAKMNPSGKGSQNSGMRGYILKQTDEMANESQVLILADASGNAYRIDGAGNRTTIGIQPSTTGTSGLSADPGTGLPIVTDEKDFNKLKSGDEFIDSADGKKYKKP